MAGFFWLVSQVKLGALREVCHILYKKTSLLNKSDAHHSGKLRVFLIFTFPPLDLVKKKKKIYKKVMHRLKHLINNNKGSPDLAQTISCEAVCSFKKGDFLFRNIFLNSSKQNNFSRLFQTTLCTSL